VDIIRQMVDRFRARQEARKQGWIADFEKDAQQTAKSFNKQEYQPDPSYTKSYIEVANEYRGWEANVLRKHPLRSIRRRKGRTLPTYMVPPALTNKQMCRIPVEEA